MSIKNIINKLKPYKYVLTIVLIGVFISVFNYTPNTWQTGWDTLHPEFNWNINIIRHLLGMWQDNQGLGSVGGHAHAADTPRIVFLWIFDLFLPNHTLRYLWIFLMFIVGPVGSYFFIKDVIFEEKKDRNNVEIVAFLSGLFYMFNLGTVQQFIVQMEMYTTLYGMLPWVFLYATKSFAVGRKYYLYLFITMVGFTPSAYAITVFLSMYGTLLVYLFVLLIYEILTKHDKWFNKMKSFLSVNLIILSTSLYWLLPNLYFVKNKSSFVSDSNINYHFSDTIFKYNIIHGKPLDLFLNKGFLINWKNYDFEKERFYYIMQEWIEYINKPYISILLFIIVFILILGIIIAIYNFKKNIYLFAVFAVFLISAFMFMTINPPLGFIYSFLLEHLSIFKESYRNPYTKFSVELIFVYSTFFGAAIFYILKLLKSIFIRRLNINVNKKLAQLFIIIPFSFLLMYPMMPMVHGNLLSKDIRIPMPDNYFNLYAYLNKQNDDKRVLTVPIPSFWGWEYYKWKYQGAGFIWFGAKQPFLKRDFDRWNKYNEKAYEDLRDAVYSGDNAQFNYVIQNYNIGYVLYDDNIMSTGLGDKALVKDVVLDMLSTSPLLSEPVSFGNDLKLYHVKSNANSDILTTSSSEYIVDYPFQYFSRTKKSIGKFVKYEDKKFILENQNPDLENGVYYLDMDKSVNTIENGLIPASIYLNHDKKTNLFYISFISKLPQLYINDRKLTRDYIVAKYKLDDFDAKQKHILYVGDEYFTFGGLNNNTYIGTVLLNLNKDTKVYLFNAYPYRIINILYDMESLTDCSDSVSNSPLNPMVHRGKNTVTLWAYNSNNACIYKNFGGFDNKNSPVLINVSFTYNFKFPTSKGTYCLEKSGTCLNNSNDIFLPVPDGKYHEFNAFHLSLKQPEGIRFFTSNNDNNLNNIEFNNAIVELHSMQESFVLPVKNLQSAIDNYYTDIKNNGNFTIDNDKIPNIKSVIDTNDNFVLDISASDFFENSVNLPQNIKYNNSQLKFSSIGYTQDINIEYPVYNLPTNIAYFTHIDATSNGDLIYSIIDNEINYPYLYEKIKPGYNTFVMSKGFVKNRPYEGYRIGLTHKDIGDLIRTSKFKNAILVPFPENLIKRVVIVKKEDGNKEADKLSNSGDLKKFEVHKLAPFVYLYKNNTEKSLFLANSFDKGWILIDSSLEIHKPKLEKGYGNHYVIKDVKKKGIALFYPIALQFLGYGIFFITLVYMCKHRKG